MAYILDKIEIIGNKFHHITFFNKLQKIFLVIHVIVVCSFFKLNLRFRITFFSDDIHDIVNFRKLASARLGPSSFQVSLFLDYT